ELAAKYRLEPHSIGLNYSPMVKERIEQMSISFNLKGSYENLRQFISDTEQAKDKDGRDLFFAIDSVTLVDSTDSGSELNLHLAVSTYFWKPELAEQDRASVVKRPRALGGAK